MCYFSTLFQTEKTQEFEDYYSCSVTKPLAGQLPKGIKVTRSGSDKFETTIYITLVVIVFAYQGRL